MERKRDSFFLSSKKDKIHSKDKDNSNNNINSTKFNGKSKEYLNKKTPRKTMESFKEKTQEKYDENRTDLDLQNEGKDSKKPFDKKTYRLKKYSKKYKLEQWEDQRKKRLLRNYYNEVKNDPCTGSYKPVSFDEDSFDGNIANNSEVGRFVKHPDIIEKEETKPKDTLSKTKRDPFSKAKEQFNKIKQEKLQKKMELEKIREDKQQKLQEYKKKKHERFKKLSKKTRKGQPVMTGRLELLLEKIQKG